MTEPKPINWSVIFRDLRIGVKVANIVLDASDDALARMAADRKGRDLLLGVLASALGDAQALAGWLDAAEARLTETRS